MSPNGVLGTLPLLANTELDDKQRDDIEMMEASGNFRLGRADNVLDISRLDAGMAQSTARAFDLTQLARDVVASLETPASARGNALGVAPPGPGVATVAGDQARLKQICST